MKWHWTRNNFRETEKNNNNNNSELKQAKWQIHSNIMCFMCNNCGWMTKPKTIAWQAQEKNNDWNNSIVSTTINNVFRKFNTLDIGVWDGFTIILSIKYTHHTGTVLYTKQATNERILGAACVCVFVLCFAFAVTGIICIHLSYQCKVSC